MEWFEALILGIIQGLTEYLPVSSSGHLAIGSALFGIEGEENLAFTVVVHVATVFSTLVVLWKEIEWIFKGLFKWQMNEETRYVINILISMVPIGIVGVFFKDEVEAVFGSGLLIVGCMLLVTAALLSFSYYYKPKQKENISMKDAFIIISLVSYHNNRFLCTPQNRGYSHIQIGNPVHYIHNKQDYIRFIYGKTYLFTDLFLKNIIRVYYPSTGINDRKLMSHPFRLAILTVAGSSCLLVYNCLTSFGQTIKKCRLSHIGASYDCY